MLNICGKEFGNQLASIIHVDECHFIEMKSAHLLFQIHASQKDILSRYSIVSFTNCIFYKIQSSGIIATFVTLDESYLWKPQLIIDIHNTTLARVTTTQTAFIIHGADLILSGPVIFTEIKSYGLIYAKDSQIYLQHNVEFSLNQVMFFFSIRYITLKENSKLNISKNIAVMFLRTDHEMSVYREGHEDIWCAFQYINTQKQNTTFINCVEKQLSCMKRFQISH